MITVGIRELKNRLSEHLRMVRRGEEILVTDRGEVVAELRQPSTVPAAAAYPGLVRRARAGKARIGGPNRSDLYPSQEPFLPSGSARKLLDDERGER
jgi:antitoxin (DNA-binding transcriptional repressor) of toxin-antitoxin stability system